MDLLDRPTIDAMVDTVVGEWGRIDALINNAIYQGPGRMDRVLELDLDAATKLVVGNYVNQLHLIQLVVPGMLERGGGRVVNMASATATMDPPAPAGEGGWGLGYGASKAAFLRVAGQLHVEFASQGLVAFNVDPGFTTNDKPSDEQFSKRFRGAPPEVTGAAIAWLCSSPDAIEHAGTLVYSQSLCKRMQLLEGWPPMSTMTAYQLVEWGAPPEFREVDVPTPGPDEVLIKVAGVGLCHSDFMFLDAPPGIIPWELPFTLGHESAGWVEQLGADVDDLELGQAVAVAGIHSCGRCQYCLRGPRQLLPARRERPRLRRGRRPRPVPRGPRGASWCRSRRSTRAGSGRSPTPAPPRTTR